MALHSTTLRIEQLLGAETSRILTRARDLRRDSGRDLLPTTLTPLDHLLAGGLPRGQLVELNGRRSSGRFSVVLAVLASATGSGEAAALIDLGDGLDPQAAAEAGVDLSRLLWARPRRTQQALAGSELLLHSGFPLVVLDLGNPPVSGGRGSEAGWMRLARAAAARESALLVSSPYRVSGSAAATVIEAHSARPRWQGAGASPRLLDALTPRLELKKLGGSPVERSARLVLEAGGGRRGGACPRPPLEVP
jgi:hypothetical protein